MRKDNVAQQRRKQRVRRMLGLFVIALLLVAAYAAYRLIAILQTEKTSSTYYDTLRTDSSTTLLAKGIQAQDKAETPSGTTVPPPEITDAPKTAAKDFVGLRVINEDIVGWLYCEGTLIDYPIVQGGDNAYYLTHLFDKTVNKAGSLFLDCGNAADFSDGNSTVYGHHMKNGSMLASIVEYKAQAFYDAHPVMLLYTPAGEARIELFSGYVAHDEEVYTAPDFGGDEAFAAFVSEAKARSTFTSSVEVQPEDRILTLVTCSYETRNARYVLLGKMVRIKRHELKP